MLDTISNLVRNVTVIVVIAGFLEMLLPAGEIKKFVKTVLGLFILVTILNPLISLLDQNKSAEVLAWQDPIIKNSSLETILGQSEEISQEMNEKAMVMYQENLAKQLETVVNLIKGVAWTKVTLKLTAEDNHKLQNEIELVNLIVGMKKEDVAPGEERKGIQQVEEIKVSISQEREKKYPRDIIQNQELEDTIRATVKIFFSLKDEQIHIQIVSDDERGEDYE
ncbi:MAG: stage III sporulation protein AF [Dehalobacterium sp.]|jgi:stage III sporulation protein AF